MLAMNSYLKLIVLCVLVVAFFVTGHFADSSRPEWKKVSPFTAISIEDEIIFAEYEGTYYELTAIEGITSQELIKVAKRRFGRLWQKRIREDIADVLAAAGVSEERYVDLELKERETGKVKKVSDAEMTKENRAKGYSLSC